MDSLFEQLADIGRAHVETIKGTYCGLLDQEVLRDTENFKRIESHYTADGIETTFKGFDGRNYKVK